MYEAVIEALKRGPAPERISDALHIMVQEELEKLGDAGDPEDVAKLHRFHAEIPLVDPELLETLDFVDQDENLSFKLSEIMSESWDTGCTLMGSTSVTDYLEHLLHELRKRSAGM